jgi:hypothetical protein
LVIINQSRPDATIQRTENERFTIQMTYLKKGLLMWWRSIWLVKRQIQEVQSVRVEIYLVTLTLMNRRAEVEK